MRYQGIVILSVGVAIGLPQTLHGFDEPAATGKEQPSTQVVIAEGVGKTPDDALKDAFRDAVRQVVGAVVDAEIRVRNDEVIDDQILTYSDGFIKTYQKVPGSEKRQEGLTRLKIRATVERRSVIAKLTAAKVAVKGLDGENLFAEVTTSTAEGV